MAETSGTRRKKFCRKLPEDGSLKSLNFSKKRVCNTMIVRTPNCRDEPNESTYLLATFDRTLCGTGWPADDYVDKLIPGLDKVSICREEKGPLNKKVETKESPLEIGTFHRRPYRTYERQSHRPPYDRFWKRRSVPMPKPQANDIEPWVHKPWEPLPATLNHMNQITNFTRPPLLGDRPKFIDDSPVIKNSIHYVESYNQPELLTRNEQFLNYINNVPSSEHNPLNISPYNNLRQQTTVGNRFDDPNKPETSQGRWKFFNGNNFRSPHRQRVSHNYKSRYAKKRNYQPNAKRCKLDINSQQGGAPDNLFGNQSYELPQNNYRNFQHVNRPYVNIHNTTAPPEFEKLRRGRGRKPYVRMNGRR